MFYLTHFENFHSEGGSTKQAQKLVLIDALDVHSLSKLSRLSWLSSLSSPSPSPSSLSLIMFYGTAEAI